jgi:hypothetical protein
MIVFSDNFSKEVLLERLRMLPGSTVRNAYMDLGLETFDLLIFGLGT